MKYFIIILFAMLTTGCMNYLAVEGPGGLKLVIGAETPNQLLVGSKDVNGFDTLRIQKDSTDKAEVQQPPTAPAPPTAPEPPAD